MDKQAKPPSIDRRTFAKTIAAAGIGMAVGSTTALAQGPVAAGPRKRYALVGTGGRSGP